MIPTPDQGLSGSPWARDLAALLRPFGYRVDLMPPQARQHAQALAKRTRIQLWSGEPVLWDGEFAARHKSQR